MECKQCNAVFEISDEDLKFYDKVSPIIGGKKYPVPPPKLCPDCRMQRRMVWRNERSLYKRKCDFSGDDIVSCFAPDKPHKVYKKDVWWGDQWDPLEYGKDFDFNRPFFEQIEELIVSVPWFGLIVDKLVNSEYANFCYNLKDCYLVYASDNNESCFYCNSIWSSKDCIDCFQIFDSELCYSCNDITNCYNCAYLKKCNNLSDCLFCEGCQNCKNCFGCVNMVGKQYCFMNEQLTKEEYEKKLGNLGLDSYSRIGEAREFFNKHRLKYPMRYAQIINCENSTGDDLKDCKNAKVCFDTSGAEDSKWLFLCNGPIKDCYDASGADNAELIYEAIATGMPTSRALFSVLTWKGAYDLMYCVLCPSTQNCFGCVGLKKGKYCILNKQYTKEEYEALVPKIIEHMTKTGEWGEFFPVHLSPFDYNETIAKEYFPLSKEDVLKNGWRWRKEDEKAYQPSNYQIPDSIKEVLGDITKEILACEKCKKNYKIIPQELKFYQTHNIPIPHNCSDCRLDFLLSLRNPRKLWSRKCDKCHADIESSYAPERKETVYCEKCYLEEVY